MDQQRFRRGKPQEQIDELQLLVERGRRLHNQAVRDGWSAIWSAVTPLSKRYLSMNTGDPSLRNHGKRDSLNAVSSVMARSSN